MSTTGVETVQSGLVFEDPPAELLAEPVREGTYLGKSKELAEEGSGRWAIVGTSKTKSGAQNAVQVLRQAVKTGKLPEKMIFKYDPKTYKVYGQLPISSE